MTLMIYNTLSRKKEEFKPIAGKKVGMYVCGITAYDKSHLGHMRPAITFDFVRRYLMYKGYDVTFIRNYTDVDDKIINRAIELKVNPTDLAIKYIGEYENNMRELNVLEPTSSPKATEHIPDMIAMIETLIDKGLAYKSVNDVYYMVRGFKEYGKLSNRNIEELESGARIAVDEKKNDPLDFVLWKGAKENEPCWDSPWGKGRPGWHIECSAMSTKYLGQPFDIHGGGVDLVFPHHENEIAQAEGANDCGFAKYWMHNGLIKIDGEKMSKSLNNFITIDDVLKKYDAEAIRFFLLSTHYRSPLDYTEESMRQANLNLERFYETISRLPSIDLSNNLKDSPKHDDEFFKKLGGFQENFCAALDDDFNSAKGIGLIFDLLRSLNRFLDTNVDEEKSISAALKVRDIQSMLAQTLGIMEKSSQQYKDSKLSLKGKKVDDNAIKRLVDERIEAKRQKNFKRADEIRDELNKMGVKIKDKPDGTTEWSL